MKPHTYRNYMLSVLAMVMAFNYVDRYALGLFLQDIKIELSLSDTQLGLLTGIAFALFYSVMGIPIARWADRGNRVTIITVTTAMWSAAVALCGAAGTFTQLLMIRVAIAVGEAGCQPPALSLISDYFSRAERPHAVGLYKLGGAVSLVIGYLIAGWLNELYGWRLSFVMLGLPGLALAALAWLTLREPRNSAPPLATSKAMPADESPTLREVCATLARNVSFRHLVLGYSVAIFFGAGIAQWNPSFFIRSYGLSSGVLGTWFAMILGVGSFIGTYVGGRLASHHAANNERLQLRSVAIVYVLVSGIAVCMYLSSNLYAAFAFMAVIAVVGATIIAPLFATIQALVPQRMRAMATAVVFLFANLVGLGIGPLTVGVLSDKFAVWAGPESLRYALITLCPGYFWAAWHLWRASRTVLSDVAGAAQFDHVGNARPLGHVTRNVEDEFDALDARPLTSKH